MNSHRQKWIDRWICPDCLRPMRRQKIYSNIDPGRNNFIRTLRCFNCDYETEAPRLTSTELLLI